MAQPTSLREKGVERVVLDRRALGLLAVRLDAVLQAELRVAGKRGGGRRGMGAGGKGGAAANGKAPRQRAARRRTSSQHALPVCTPAWPKWMRTTSRILDGSARRPGGGGGGGVRLEAWRKTWAPLPRRDPRGPENTATACSMLPRMRRGPSWGGGLTSTSKEGFEAPFPVRAQQRRPTVTLKLRQGRVSRTTTGPHTRPPRNVAAF